jgi:hypothetical protein
MLEEQKERGRKIAQMPPPERNQFIARMMFGDDAEKAQMALFMLMGSWGIAPPGPPPGAGGPPPGNAPHHGH